MKDNKHQGNNNQNKQGHQDSSKYPGAKDQQNQLNNQPNKMGHQDQSKHPGKEHQKEWGSDQNKSGGHQPNPGMKEGHNQWNQQNKPGCDKSNCDKSSCEDHGKGSCKTDQNGHNKQQNPKHKKSA